MPFKAFCALVRKWFSLQLAIEYCRYRNSARYLLARTLHAIEILIHTTYSKWKMLMAFLLRDKTRRIVVVVVVFSSFLRVSFVNRMKFVHWYASRYLI